MRNLEYVSDGERERERAVWGEGGLANCGGKKTRSISILIQVFSSSSSFKKRNKRKDTHGTHTHTNHHRLCTCSSSFHNIFLINFSFLFNFCFGIS